MYWICSLQRRLVGRACFKGRPDFICLDDLLDVFDNRMFTSSLTEEVKHIEEEIAAVSDKVDDPVMCSKIRQFVYAPRDIQNMFKNDASKDIRCLLFAGFLIFAIRRIRAHGYHHCNLEVCRAASAIA